MASSGGDPDVPASGIYYCGQNRSSQPHYSGLSLPTGTRIDSWAYGTASKDWENIHHRKTRRMKTLQDTDLVPEMNRQFTTSELAGSSTKWMGSDRDHSNESMPDEGDKSIQIVPYDHSATLSNHLPLQISWKPSIQFEQVLQKTPEEACMQAIAAANIAEKKAETQGFLSFPTEKERRRSEPSLHMDVNEDAAIVPRQRKRKCDPDPAAADFSSDLAKPGISSETNMYLEEEEKPTTESDGLEDYWKDYALAVESTKLDAADEAANKEDLASEKVEDNDCNHDIRIHEDLGHVCRICGMIVRKGLNQ